MLVLRNISYFLAGIVFSKGLGFFISFALAKWLGPGEFGVWITLMLIVAYGPIVSFGAVEVLSKMIPYYRGGQNLFRVREVENSVMGAIVLSAGLALFLVPSAPLVLFLYCSGSPLIGTCDGAHCHSDQLFLFVFLLPICCLREL